MNIAVIAANGRSGRVFVEAALAAGHSVRAGVRGTYHLPRHSRLTILACDATDKHQLTKLLAGQDAVVSLLGHVKGSPADVQTRAIQNAIEVMRESGQQRIVSLTGTGVRFPGDTITLLDRILNVAVSIIDPARVHDGKRHVELLATSGLEWTVIRVLKLQNTAPRPFKLREHGPAKPFVGRQEVAAAILQVLEQPEFIRQAPMIGKA